MKYLITWLYEFNRGERIGIYGLISIILVLITVRGLLPYIKVEYGMVQVISDFDLYKRIEETRINKKKNDNYSFAFKELNNSAHINGESGKPYRKEKNGSLTLESKESEKELFSFDPNTLDSLGFVSLGLSSFSISNIIKWRSTGAGFSNVESFRKIFGISKQQFQKLSPFVSIPKTKHLGKKKWNSTKKSVIEPIANINLNTATASELKRIKGIGDVLSGRIVKYRKMLGGFHNTNQIKEVYGITDSFALVLTKQFDIKNRLAKIQINKIHQDTLSKHPYINWRTAKMICRYRNHHGNYLDINDLFSIVAIDSSLILKLKPYLSFVE